MIFRKQNKLSYSDFVIWYNGIRIFVPVGTIFIREIVINVGKKTYMYRPILATVADTAVSIELLFSSLHHVSYESST
jgi:hypothetical protein